MTLREGLFLGSAAAALSVLPASVRAAGSGAAWPLAWLVLTGGAALLLGPVSAFARAARPAPRGLLALFAACALGAVPLAVFGALLHQKTHHRPLGAATFALLSLLALAAGAFVAWRAFATLERFTASARGRLLPLSILGVMLAAGLLLATWTFGATSLRGSLLDGLLLVVFAVACVAVRMPQRLGAYAARLGVPVWAVLVVACMWLSRGSVGEVVGQVAPVLSPLNGW